MPSRVGSTDMHTNSQRKRQQAQELPKFQPDRIPALRRGSRHKVQLLTKKLFVIEPVGKGGKIVLLKWHMTISTNCRVGPIHAQEQLANAKQMPWFCFVYRWVGAYFLFGFDLVFLFYWFSFFLVYLFWFLVGFFSCFSFEKEREITWS